MLEAIVVKNLLKWLEICLASVTVTPFTVKLECWVLFDDLMLIIDLIVAQTLTVSLLFSSKKF